MQGFMDLCITKVAKFNKAKSMRRVHAHRTRLGKLTHSWWAPLRKWFRLQWSVARFWQLAAAERSGATGGRFANECLVEFARQPVAHS